MAKIKHHSGRGITKDFSALCQDFANRKPTGAPIDTVPYATINWLDGDMSSNSLLRRYLVRNGIDFVNDFNGTVWFLHDGGWTRCKVRSERQADGTPYVAHFERCIF